MNDEQWTMDHERWTMNDKQRIQSQEERTTNRKKSLFRFRQWPVYKAAKSFRKKIRELAERLPGSERNLLKHQISSAADSICLNIAEGSNKLSDIDFSRYLNNSETSLEEIVCCLDLIFEDELITKVQFEEYLNEAEMLGAQLNDGLVKSPTMCHCEERSDVAIP